jgi:hypothetical protein
MADPGAVAAVQRERHHAGCPVVTEGERADSDAQKATCRITGIADCCAEIMRHNLAECGCCEFMRRGIAHIDAIKVVAAAEYHVRV